MFNFKKHKTEINKICKKYEVKNLIAFGSSLTDNFDSHSDIDLLLELKSPKNGLIRYMNLKLELEELFSHPVDLVIPKALKNEKLKNSIYSNIREIYAA